MPNIPTDDQPGFVAERPEHCFACYRLIRPGQTYYLTVEHEVLSADCALDAASMMPLDEGVIEGRDPRERGPGRRGEAGPAVGAAWPDPGGGATRRDPAPGECAGRGGGGVGGAESPGRIAVACTCGGA
jgi:hypothetical protein